MQKNGQSCRECTPENKENFYLAKYMLDDIDWQWWQSILQPSTDNKDLFPVNITIKLPSVFILTGFFIV